MHELQQIKIEGEKTIKALESALSEKPNTMVVFIALSSEEITHKRELIRYLQDSGKLLVCEIEGDILQSNMEIALYCHMRIAYEGTVITNFRRKVEEFKEVGLTALGRNNYDIIEDRTYDEEGLLSIGFINKIFSKSEQTEGVHKYVLDLIGDKDQMHITTIVQCYNQYLKFGLNGPRQMLLQEEANAFSILSGRHKK